MTTKDIGKLKVAATGDREIVMTRQFDAPRRMIYEAWTKPELLRRWLAGPEGWEMTVCTIDLRIGGAYRYEWSKEKTGERMGIGGEYREIVPNEKLVATEKFDMAWYPGGAVVTTLLTEAEYRSLQEIEPFDTTTSSWVQTPAQIRKLGGALFCDRRYDTVFVYHNGAESYYAARGFRCSLRV